MNFDFAQVYQDIRFRIGNLIIFSFPFTYWLEA